MVAAWIGKGVVTPFCASLRTMPSGRPRSAKVIWGVWVVWGVSAVSGTSVTNSSSWMFSDMTM